MTTSIKRLSLVKRLTQRTEYKVSITVLSVMFTVTLPMLSTVPGTLFSSCVGESGLLGVGGVTMTKLLLSALTTCSSR